MVGYSHPMSAIFNAYTQHEAAIRRIIAKYRPNPADIDEISQETFLKGFAAERDQEIHDPANLLYRIARSLALNAATRKSAKQQRSIEDFAEAPVFRDENHLHFQKGEGMTPCLRLYW